MLHHHVYDDSNTDIKCLRASLHELCSPISYHTSILSGEAWVHNPILGHPDRIRHSLGVSLDVFEAFMVADSCNNAMVH
ncbi:hypothetical protein BS17DRAFT_701647 [Gyrodon lividus]|nr:hypothetical protein BS17DRAFT_701647 [Gyrodon lividus]